MPSILIPPGLCQCGCGQPTKISPRNASHRGYAKGEPRRFVEGHNARKLQPPPEITPTCAIIILPPGVQCLVSTEDADLAEYTWHLAQDGYVLRSEMLTQRPKRRSRVISIHRMILARMLGRALQPGEQCDHRNGKRLDNRRANLRLATPRQNSLNKPPDARNTSGYRGVSWIRRAGKWGAGICIKGKSFNLGRFDTPEEASAAYEQAAGLEYSEWRRRD